LTAGICVIQQFNALKAFWVVHRNPLIHTMNNS
jgi:hypothetical protein